MTSEKVRRTPLCMGAQAYLFFRAAPCRKKNCNVLRAGRLSFQEEFPFGGAPPYAALSDQGKAGAFKGRRAEIPLLFALSGRWHRQKF